ncbi:hypothetical protein PANT111_150126 [Pantoea brenneri]|uniref:Uncharacterized protein n=1 Tax=Pantoea brenneri TaxID=472694 RepID=A0AAX3J3J1_9GAMM|nr:hypothetical protein [Pantoea brenneri]VXB51544.1 hypothetical protein PANT111_150126 [Pantoea brenneri]
MTEEQKQALIDEVVIQALRDDVRQWQQRAEAAEAKLAELEKQDPVAYTDAEELETMRKGTFADMFTPCDEYKSDPLWIPLFTHPAPAADLAELVPVPPEFLSAEQNSQGMFELSEDCMTRLAIALSQQAKGLVIKPGHALAPVEPTAAMYEAGDQQLTTKQVWNAMLAAAPEVE